MKTIFRFLVALFVLIAAVVHNYPCLAQAPQDNAEQQAGDEVKEGKKANSKDASKKKKNAKAPKFYTPEQLMDIVRKAATSTRDEDWVYLDASRRNIAEYLYFIQMAQDARLQDEQIVSRIKILVENIKKSTYMWKSGGKDDRFNGTTVKTDYIFSTVYHHLFSGLPYDKESERMKKIRELEEKANALYKESQVADGL